MQGLPSKEHTTEGCVCGGGDSDFIAEKPGKNCLSPVTKVNISSGKPGPWYVLKYVPRGAVTGGVNQQQCILS